jgi:hypothetical protein
MNHTFHIAAWHGPEKIENRDQSTHVTFLPSHWETNSGRFLNTASNEARSSSFQSLIHPLYIHTTTGSSDGVCTALKITTCLAVCARRTTFLPEFSHFAKCTARAPTAIRAVSTGRSPSCGRSLVCHCTVHIEGLVSPVFPHRAHNHTLFEH